MTTTTQTRGDVYRALIKYPTRRQHLRRSERGRPAHHSANTTADRAAKPPRHKENKP